ncbi:MAG: PIN domain-containing protein [Defluviitaleaceae bacterium]|nr:PIN domain-containing protein [Defluviitaleaceae bacterium]MCL2263694.1 PIN domain-containing protein [Defluviitaleaceae bacterium]
MSSIFVLDACALLAVARNEKGADVVVNLYHKASIGEAKLFLNRVNILEVYYDFYRYKGKDYADSFVKTVKRSEVQICEFDEVVFTHAGRLKATYKISLADSIALAQAIVVKGSLLTCDHHEFDAIEGKEPLNFYWMR